MYVSRIHKNFQFCYTVKLKGKVIPLQAPIWPRGGVEVTYLLA